MSNPIDCVNSYYNALNRRDWEIYARLIDPQCEIKAPGMNAIGIDAIRAFDQGWVAGFPDTKITPLRQVTDGERVFSENTFSGTHTATLSTPAGDIPPTGESVSATYVGLFVVRNGRLVEQCVYYDRLELLERLGLAPSGGPQ